MQAEFLLYCRSGYEADLLAELDDKLARSNIFGYARFSKDSGFLRYNLNFASNKLKGEPKTEDLFHKMLPLESLMFARQKSMVISEVNFNDMQDRAGAIVQALKSLREKNKLDIAQFGDIRVEYPDTEDGKTIAKFCKKFSVPLRQNLRKEGLLTNKPQVRKAYLHVFFERGERCILALSFADDRSEDLLGIRRLKFPADAPSRSTLKLEEAITHFCNKAQQTNLFQPGMSAVDLGACPGGWTYQLVSRGIHVEAVDNGAMDEKLMQTGLVTYMPADGFSYQPLNKHVDWLVCDMIEQPDRVARLMIQWLNKRLASAAIFNLKLPMKKRYSTLAPLIKAFEKELVDEHSDIYMQAKHLYHNRDEVTFLIIKNSQMLSEFYA